MSHRCVAVGMMIILSLLAAVATGEGDTTADIVLGQPNFTSNTANNGGISLNSLSGPIGIAVDSAGRIFVADNTNDRVLIFNNLADSTADDALGDGAINFPPRNVFMNGPCGIAIDSASRVYIADAGNNRVLVFNNLSDRIADFVYGQPNFDIGSAGTSANTMNGPFGVAVDSASRLYVADAGNNRVLVFNNLSDTTADIVLGQPNFTSNVANNGGVSANSLRRPLGIAVDSASRLYVGDAGNNRVLVFNNLSDTAADIVLGQPNFTSNTEENGGVMSATSMSQIGGVAVDSSGRIYVGEFVRAVVFNNLSDTTADIVLGKPGFTDTFVGLSATSLAGPSGFAFDTSGRTYVTDQFNNRVLVFKSLPTQMPVVAAVAADTMVTKAPREPPACLISRLVPNTTLLSILRCFRDCFLCASLGRMLVAIYYWVG